jgi:hypothetical protein
MAERVDPGDPIYADDFNKMRSAQEAISRMSGGGGVKVAAGAGGLSVRGPTATAHPRRAVTEAHGINVSNEDFLAYQPCVVFGNMFTGSKAEGIPLFKLDWPMSGDEGFFSICLEPIKVGRTGRIAIAGVCQARVKNPDGQWNAEISHGQNYLLGGSAGSAQLLAAPIADNDVHLCLVRFPVGGTGAQVYADYCSTVEIGNMVGPQTVDGVAVPAGKLVLLTAQSNAALNRLWKVNADAWSDMGQPKIVPVLSGTSNGQREFYLTGTNQYSPENGAGAEVVMGASTANIATLSGLQTIDGVSGLDARKFLLKNQTTTSQNGVWRQSPNAWTKVGQPEAVYVKTGTANGRLSYILTSTNTYAAIYGVFG